MGIIDTLLMSAWARGRNNDIIRIRNHAVDCIEGSNTENLILLGGQDITRAAFDDRKYLSISGEVKTNVILCAVKHARRSGYGTVCFFNRNHKPSIPEMDDGAVVFGENTSYRPLNTMAAGMTEERINEYFERIIKYHCRDNGTDVAVISGIIRMYVNILASKNISYVTVDNLDLLVKLGRSNDVISFQKEIIDIIGDELPQLWEHYNILNWDVSQTKFLEFWQRYKNCLDQYDVVGCAPYKSLYSVMMSKDKGPCVCYLDTSNNFMKMMLLSELEMVYGDVSGGIMLIDYFVPLPVDKDHLFFSEIYMCMVGDSLKRLGIEPGIIRNPTVDCLGVEAVDANDIINYVVSSQDIWRVGAGGATADAGNIHAHLHSEVVKALHEGGLSLGRIPDGSAVRINSKGITNIRQLRVVMS